MPIIPNILNRLSARLRSRKPVFCNIAEGSHAGNLPRVLESSIINPYVFAKPGASSGKVTLAASGDAPLGVLTDTGASGETVNLALLGSATSTRLATAGANITQGDFLVCDANAAAIKLPASGTHYIVGRALHDAASGGLVEFDPCVPVEYVNA